MNFEEQKKKQLSREDASSIGSWDPKIKGLCEKLNKKKNYYTTSSCAGRIILLKGEMGKEPNKFLFRTHKKTSFNELKKALNGVEYEGLVEFKQSPCILHVACKDLESSQELVNNAKLSGWKKSGIMNTKKRFIVELQSTEHLAFPIMNNQEILVDDNFLKLVIGESNMRLGRVWKKIDKLSLLV